MSKRIGALLSGAGVQELPVLVLVVVMVGMMVIPLPYQILDFLITLNLTVALLVLLVSLTVRKPLDFSVLPALLLLTTLFRLALNVSSARLILLNGFAGNVIQGFGQFVVGGNPLVGFIIFIILVVIQFIVITRGAERVAEVAARFTLDAMPGKQMAIDADLNSGLIDEEQARARRQEIEREADFYGAMDGASKFVKGDAIAGMVIIAVNILGGFAVGLLEHGLSFSQALSTYTLLTVGDGLVSQIPALLISTATGLVVTRAAQDASFGQDLVKQITAQPRLLWVASGTLFVFGWLPGMPWWSFTLLAALFGGLAYTLSKQSRQRDAASVAPVRAETPEPIEQLMNVDPLEIELGLGLLPLADEAKGGDLLERVVMIRRQLALELGILLAPVRLRDNLELDADAYGIKLRGIRLTQGHLHLGQLLAMNPGGLPELPGTPTKEPVFGLDALWLSFTDRGRAEELGYTVVDPSAVIATHISEVVRDHAAELLGRQEVAALLEGVKKHTPAVVEELTPGLLSIGEIQKVLQNLLQEHLPIRDLVPILEALADFAPQTRDPEVLTEAVRQRMRRVICHHFGLTVPGKRGALTLAPETEAGLWEAQSDATRAGIDQATRQKLYGSVSELLAKTSAGGKEAVVVVAPRVRRLVQRLLESRFPRIPVLSYAEIEAHVQLESVGVIQA